MATMTTSYIPGATQVQTSAPPVAAPAGAPGGDYMASLSDYAKQIMDMRLAAAKRRDMQDQAAFTAANVQGRIASQNGGAPTTPRQQQYMPQMPVNVLGGGGGNGSSGTIAQQMQAVALRDAMNQVNAKERRAPTRTVSGANIISGETVDPLAMTGYDREAQLPQAAHLTQDR